MHANTHCLIMTVDYQPSSIKKCSMLSRECERSYSISHHTVLTCKSVHKIRHTLHYTNE